MWLSRQGTTLQRQSRDANINMAGLRFRRRTKRLFFVLLVACLFWLMYLLSSLPTKGNVFNGPSGHKGSPEKSVSRQYFTTTYKLVHKVEPVKNVLDAPKPPSAGAGFAAEGHEDKLLNPSVVGVGSKAEKDTGSQSESKKGDMDMRAIGSLIKNKTLELGVKLKNKTLEMGEKVKNKTLEQLAVIGMKPKHMPQLVFVPFKWNLTVSFDDIGEVMKETQFLNKVDPLNLDGPILLSTLNRTANFTYKMPVKFGYCDCFERYCFCCSQIVNKKLHLNSTGCSNFTFMSKTHELDLQFSLDGKPVHQSLISADKSPLLCLGSYPRVADICVHFFNMTFKVNEHYNHQTQLLGCTDLSLNLYNKTIGAFPVDCFQIPGDPGKSHKERKFNMMFNWMP
ncbi:uncharacterized protein [Littorina saxatilis]